MSPYQNRSEGTAARKSALFVSFTVSAYSSRVFRLVENLSARGWAVQLIVPDDVRRFAPPPFGAEIVPTTLSPVLRKLLPGVFGDWVQAKWRQRRLVRHAASQHDAVIALDPDALPTAVEIANRDGSKLFYDVQEFHDEVAGITAARRRWLLKTERHAAPRISACFTVNSEIVEHYGQTRGNWPPCRVLPNFQPNTGRRPQKAAGDTLHARAGLSPDTRILLFHGLIGYARGVEKLLEISRDLPSDWKLVCMGWGPLAGLVETQSEGHAVLIEPARPEELLSLLEDASLGAIFYRSDVANHRRATPNKLYEFTSAGVPILTIGELGLSKIVSGEQIGWVVDEDAASEKVAELIAGLSREDLSQASERCRAWARSNSWETYLEPVIEWLETPPETRPAS